MVRRSTVEEEASRAMSGLQYYVFGNAAARQGPSAFWRNSSFDLDEAALQRRPAEKTAK